MIESTSAVAHNDLSPHVVRVGVLCRLCGMTEVGCDLLSAVGATACSRPVAEHIIDSLVELYEDDLKDRVQSEWDSDLLINVIIVDNKNFQGWLKRNLSTRNFMQQTASTNSIISLKIRNSSSLQTPVITRRIHKGIKMKMRFPLNQSL